MRKNYLYLIIILIITAAGAAVTGALTAPPSKEESVGAYFSDAEDFEALTYGKEKCPFDPHAILFNGNAVPCDATEKTFFIPQDPGEEEWTGLLSSGSKGSRIRILDDLGADSLDVVELIMSLEDEFGIKLTGDVIKGFETVGDIIALMNK